VCDISGSAVKVELSTFNTEISESSQQHQQQQQHFSSQLEQQEYYLSPYEHVVSNYDEEQGDIFPNLFQDPIVDNSMHESSSLSLGFDHDVPIFDKYSDEEEDFKFCGDLFASGISLSSTFQQKDDQQCTHVMINESCESKVQKFKEDSSCKDFIVGEGDQKFLHDTYFQTQFSFDHYHDSDVEDPEHTYLFFFQKLSVVIRHYIRVMNLNHRDMVKGRKKF
jgi:hypothetical protein